MFSRTTIKALIGAEIMVNMSLIDAQLTKLGIRKTFFCRPEIRQLQHILMDHEQVIKCAIGRYQGGFAILVATEQRLLLVDKKPLYLTVEDIRYDMISEVDISSRLIDATVTIYTVNKQIVFSAVRQQQLRGLTTYVQQRVMELRQYHEMPQPQVAEPQSGLTQALPQMASSAFHQLTNHIPHMPSTISNAVSYPRRHIPSHLHHAIGSIATSLASRLHNPNHNPNPYTRAPLMVRQRWPTLG